MDLPKTPFLPLAILTPVVLALFHHDLGHHGDIAFFHEWYVAFRGGADFYRAGPGINYPIVGVLIVALPSAVIDRALGHVLSLDEFRLVLKTTLVGFEIGFVFAAASLARGLGLARPNALALLLYALPVTWAGGSWFGQTDVAGSTLLLVSGAALVRYRRDGARRALCLGLAALIAALLSKQLTWFALPGLGLLLALALYERRDRVAIAIALGAPGLLFVADPFLDLPGRYVSHLAFVLTGGGSSHGSLLVASGASLWALVAPGGTPADAVRFLGINGLGWGFAAWIAIMILGFVGVSRSVAQTPNGASEASAGATRRASFTSSSLILYAGLGQLAMATVLTGVHERYLAHAVPLVLLGVWGSDARARWSIALGVATGILAGLFVLSTIHSETFDRVAPVLAHPSPLAIVSALWLVVVVGTRLLPASAPPLPP